MSHDQEQAEHDPYSVMFLGQFLMEQVQAAWGIEPLKETPERSDYKFTKCRPLELAREKGVESMDICRAHELFWDQMGQSLAGRPRFRFTQMMKYGAPFCVAAIEPPAVPGGGR